MLLVGSISFIGFGIMTAVLPLLYTEKGMQMSFVVKAIILLVSGVYYPVGVLPFWMQPLARISPATYVLDGLRAAILDNQPIWSPAIWSFTWPLIITGIVSIPLGLYIFRVARTIRQAYRQIKTKRITFCRGRFIAPTADLSAIETIADQSAVGAINRPLQEKG